jgi:hypothetical protein
MHKDFQKYDCGSEGGSKLDTGQKNSLKMVQAYAILRTNQCPGVHEKATGSWAETA